MISSSQKVKMEKKSNFQVIPARKNKGRQKLKMEKIENESNLQVTFSKRRAGLFKKASELCVLCGVETLIIVFSPTRKAFSFGHPDVQSVLIKFLNEDTANPAPGNVNFSQMIMEATRNSNIRSRNLELTQLNSMLAMEKRKAKELKELKKQGQMEGWIAPPIEGFNLEQLNFFEKIIMNYEKHFDEDVAKFMSHNPNQATNLNATNEQYTTGGMNVINNVPSNHPSIPHVFNDMATSFDTTQNEMVRINNTSEVTFSPEWINNWAAGLGDTGVYAIGETSVTNNIGATVSAPNEHNNWAPSFSDTGMYPTSKTSVSNNFGVRDSYDPMGLVPNDLFMPSYDPKVPYGVADSYRLTGDPGDAIFNGGSGLGMYPDFNNGKGPSQF